MTIHRPPPLHSGQQPAWFWLWPGSALTGSVESSVVKRLGRLAVGLSISLLVACSPPATDNATIANGDANQTASPSLGLHPCEPDELAVPRVARALECGQLLVPENPAQPDGRQLHIQVARLPAIAANSQPDPLVLLAGGPGQAATEMLSHLWPLISRINRQRDIVLIDQRGTGQSAPLDCQFDDLDEFVATEQLLTAQTQALRDCLDELQEQADLRFYTTPIAVADFEQVRRALGYRQINLWGLSYGTRVALDYMRRYPESVRTAVLDGVAPMALQLPAHLTRDGNRALSRLFAHCDSRADCAAAYGDLTASTQALVEQLNRSPVTITLVDPLTEASSAVELNGELLSAYLRLALYSRELGPLIPIAIERLVNEDYRLLSSLVGAAEQSNQTISVGLHYSVLCSEDWPQIDRDAPPESNGPLQLNAIAAMAAVCEFWPRGTLPEDYHQPVNVDHPVLLLSGQWDPVTPPRWAAKAAEHLTNSQHLVVEGGHHGVSLLGCLPNVINDFVGAGDFTNLDSQCVDDISPLPPFLSATGPAMMTDGNITDNDDHRDQAPAGASE